VGGAAHDREEVEEPGGGESSGDLHHVGRAEATGRQLVARDPRAHHEVAPDLAADLAQHLESEAHPVFEAAAVVVGPSVEER